MRDYQFRMILDDPSPIAVAEARRISSIYHSLLYKAMGLSVIEIKPCCESHE